MPVLGFAQKLTSRAFAICPRHHDITNPFSFWQVIHHCGPTSMSPHGYTQGSIAQWANKNFLTDFRELSGAKQVAVQLHKISNSGSQGYIKGLVIGIGINEKGGSIEILVWLNNGSMIIGYVTKVGSRIQETRFDSTESVMESVTEFKEPFGCVLHVEGEAAIAKLEALVRYYLLLKGSTQAVKDRITEFEEHFGDACRDIAAAHKTEREDPPDIRLGPGADAWTSLACKVSWYIPSIAIDTIPTTDPDRHGLYDFEIFVEGLRNTSGKVNMSSQSPKSHIAHGTEGASV
ncbi:hypothetical protein HBI56_171140 [Parastagonospora nodorum]|nr:hypothetical protein HBH56_233960 [Parastagonospora nodorum]KAH3921303.1 hypothetical protein HBH54_242020 [Parastagonospora nodorum]KAH3963480.1 hypothetical protein HBH51_166480 [Parastagonospora nodorum]KAH3995170.1 hypothetical protein HBI10_174990 [Parastagonospora nodorum]KAH4017475.1 hypothetical protein HBI13_140540 [Parastagonospora nodorum]